MNVVEAALTAQPGASVRAVQRAVRRVIANSEELSAEQRLRLLAAIDDAWERLRL